MLSSLQRIAHQSLARVEASLDRWRQRRRLRRGFTRPVRVVPYLGYGSASRVRLRGRVLMANRLRDAAQGDRSWQALAASYRRFESDEVPGLCVRARLGSVETAGVSDEEGYLDLTLTPHEPLAPTLWHEASMWIDEPDHGLPPREATARVQVPSEDAQIGIISDIDDTILHTQATSLLQMARTTLFNSARQRTAFPGVGAFYSALQDGPGGEPVNPIFYVSSSPWNLYDLLIDFMDHRGIPQGPLFLRDLGLTRDTFIQSTHGDHKGASIDAILGEHPELPFLLIGDSGQHDPEIYADVVARWPGRVHAVYIRDVSHADRDTNVDTIGAQLEEHEVPLLRVATTVDAARHAATEGWITAAQAAAVAEAVEADLATA